MGVNLSGAIPANPDSPTSWLDQLGEAAGPIGQAVSDGLNVLLTFVGDIFKGAADLGMAALSGLIAIADGVFSFFGSIAGGIISFFTGRPPREPLPDVFSPIMTDLEGEIEPFLDKVEKALSDSASAGSAAETANNDLASLIEEDNLDSPLWNAQVRINSLEIQRDNAQDTAIKALTQSTKAMQRYISRGMFLPDAATVNSASDDHWEVTFVDGGSSGVSDDLRKLKATGTWIGEFIYQSAVSRDGDFGPVIKGGSVTATNREFLFESSMSAGSLQYWIKPGEAKTFTGTSNPGGFSPNRDIWWNLNEFRFVAESSTAHSVFARVGWDATTREDSYGIRVLKNNSAVQELKETGIGPWFPGQDGYRTQSINIDSIDLVAGDILVFQIWAGSPDTPERKVRDTQLTIGWVKPPEESA